MPALSAAQGEQFDVDGFLLMPDMLPAEALRPLIDELVEKVQRLTIEAVRKGLLNAADTFVDEPFATRLARVSDRCRDRNWLWRQIEGKEKTAGLFAAWTHPALLDAVESLIGPEILAHPQANLRAKMPKQEETVVPWHQDLAYLEPEDAGETLIVNSWIPLVDASAESGCLQVLASSHRLGLLPHDLHDSRFHGINDDELPAGELVTCEMKVGDVLLTTERVVHRSIANESDRVRWSLDLRFSQIGQPTGRTWAKSVVVRSRAEPHRVATSHLAWDT